MRPTPQPSLNPASASAAPHADDHTAQTGDTMPLPPGYSRDARGIDFSRPVAPNGYLWWYLDAISDCGEQAMTLIVFVGSVFSPYYADARRRGAGQPENHCAFNTIFYGPGGRKRWSMTERGARHLQRSPDRYQLGPSRMDWDGKRLTAHIDERCVPLPRRMRGRIEATPTTITQHCLALDEHGHHSWRPLAPVTRVSVNFPALGMHWEGHGYLDSNQGNEPLGDGFCGWDWMRTRLENGDCAVRYEVREPLRQPRRLALRFSADGEIRNESTLPSSSLAPTRVWRVDRNVPVCGGDSSLHKTLEDTPFYARSLVNAAVGGERVTAFHESLSMLRFEQRWVQRLLPFRMPRLS